MLSAARRSLSTTQARSRLRPSRSMATTSHTEAKTLKTASYLLIGDEILSGTVKDTNGPFLAKYLRNRGIDLLRIEVIPDKMNVIIDSINRARATSTYVLTSGGIGPTHDDITYESIATAFGVPLEYDQESLARMTHYMKGRNSEVNEARKRMVLFPKGCNKHFVGSLWVPVVSMENVHIYPGVPSLFERMLLGSDSLFPEGPPFVQYEVFTKKVEGDFAAALSQFAADNKLIKIGSYPTISPDGNNYTRLFIEGRNEQLVQQAAEDLGQLTEAYNVSKRLVEAPSSAKL